MQCVKKYLNLRYDNREWERLSAGAVWVTSSRSRDRCSGHGFHHPELDDYDK